LLQELGVVLVDVVFCHSDRRLTNPRKACT
jgi:hypothetical protein